MLQGTQKMLKKLFFVFKKLTFEVKNSNIHFKQKLINEEVCFRLKLLEEVEVQEVLLKFGECFDRFNLKNTTIVE